jgi:hypothetical protein
MATNINQERLNHLQAYFDNSLVTVELPALHSQTSKGTVIHKFSGVRLGYRFVDGFASVQKKDVYKFRECYSHAIIHDENFINVEGRAK